MPSQLGVWTYSWSFSDGSLQGEGQFECVAEGAGPGVLGAYKPNPHWFAYHDGTPKFIKSYYNKAGGLTRQDAAWTVEHFYSKIVARGYNHHMNSGFLPVLPLSAKWDGQPFMDGPKAINRTIYTGKQTRRFAPVYTKSNIIILGRQARDKHRETLKNGDAFSDRPEVAVDLDVPGRVEGARGSARLLERPQCDRRLLPGVQRAGAGGWRHQLVCYERGD